MDAASVMQQAEAILSSRYGGQQQLTRPELLEGSGVASVYRCRVESNPYLQCRTLIVKHIPDTGYEFDEAGFVREVVAYQFATSLPGDVRPGPTLLGYDIQQKILIISDAGDGETLAELLEQADSEEEIRVLRALGAALGRMHASTAGKEAAFQALLRKACAAESAPDLQQVRDVLVAERIRIGLKMCRHAGIEVANDLDTLAESMQKRLLHGGMRAFTPFDLSPDNIICSQQLQFLDYEWAGFRDAISDVAFVVAGFPLHVWSKQPDAEAIEAFIAAWVNEVKITWPAVQQHDALHARLTAAVYGWALSSLAMMNLCVLDELFATDRKIAHLLEQTGLIDDQEAAEEEVAVTQDLLTPTSTTTYTRHEQLLRKDLGEAFTALKRLAGKGDGATYDVIERFADTVIARLR